MYTRNARLPLLTFISGLLLVALTPLQSEAQTYDFTPITSGTYSWNTSNSWGGVAYPNATSDVANFLGDSGATMTVELNDIITIGTLNFQGSDSRTITPGTSGALVLNQGANGDTAIITVQIGTASQLVNTPITVTDDNLSITQNSTNGGLTLGDLTFATSGRTLSVGGEGDVTLSSLLLQASTGGNLTFSNVSAGTAGSLHILGDVTKTNLTSGNNFSLTLNGTAMTTTFDGEVNLYSGTGTTGTFSIMNGGLTVFNDTVTTSALRVSGAGAVIDIEGSGNSFGTTSISPGVTVSVNGISTFGNVVMAGTASGGILAINTASTFGTVSSGTLSVIIVNSNNVSVTGITLNGGGQLRLGDGVTFNGPITINNGNAGKTISAIGDAILSGDINFVYTTAAGGFNINVDDDKTLTISGLFTGVAATVTKPFTKIGNGTLVLTANNSLQSSLVANAGIFKVNASGTYTGIIVAAAGELQLNAASTFSGPATVTGTLQINSNGVSIGGTGITLTTTGGTLGVGNGVTVDTIPFTVGASGTTKTLSSLGAAATFATTITNNASGSNFTIDVVNAGTLSLTGLYSGNGFTKTGDGTVVFLNGSNTVASTIAINGGTVRMGAAGALGAGGALVMGNTDPGVGNKTVSLDLGANSQTISAITIFGSTATNGIAANITGTGTITLGTNLTVGSTGREVGAATISPNLFLTGNTTINLADSADPNVGADLIIHGAVTSAGTVTKVGAGHLLLTNTLSSFNELRFSTVNSGTIEFRKAGIFGNTLTMYGNTTLAYSGLGDTLSLSLLSGSGSTSGQQTLIVSASDAGTTTITGAYDRNASGTGALTVGGSSDVYFDNVIGGVAISTVLATVTKIGSSTWTLSAASRGASSGTPLMTIDEGALVFEWASPTLNGLRLGTGNSTVTFDARAGVYLNATSTFVFGGPSAGSLSQANLISSNGAATVTVFSGITYDATGNPLTAVISAPNMFFQTSQSLDIGDSSSTELELLVTSDITTASNALLTKSGDGGLRFTGSVNISNAFNIGAGLLDVSGTFAATSMTASNSAVIRDSNTTGTAFSIGSGAITLADNSAFELANGVTAGVAINVNATSGARTIRSLVGADSTFNGAITVAATGANEFQLSGNGGTLWVAGDIGGSGGAGLLIDSAGTVVLTGTNDYAGNTTVSSGTLLVNGSIANDVLVSGGTLGGSGTISGTVTVNSGDLSPGNSPGTLTLGDLDMNGGDYLWQLGTLTTSGPGTNFDFVLVDAGDADLSNAANVVLDFSLLATLDQPGPDNAFWLSDHIWTILSVTGGGLVNGTFADLNQVVDLGGFGSGVFSLGYDTTNVFLQYNVAAVPEPGSLLLATLGALSFGGYGWRRRKRGAIAA